MSIYTLLLFLHVSGDIGLFIGLGMQLLGLAALRSAKRVEQARVIAGPIAIADSIGVISALLTIATGLYLTYTTWGLQTGWIAVALASIVLLIAPLIGLVIGPRMRAIVSTAREEPDGPLQVAFCARVKDPLLGTALQTMAALLLGIVFLMTNKPSLSGALISIGLALAAGLASGVPLWWRGDGRMKNRSDGML